MTEPSGMEELLDLIWALCDRSITPEQRDELEQRLHADPEARCLYALYMGMIHSLRCERLPQREARRLPKSDEPPILYLDALRPPRRRRRRLAVFALLAALAAGVLLVVWSLWQPLSPDMPKKRDHPPIAVLTGSDECRWAESEPPKYLGTRLTPGKVTLEEGLAEITFDAGAVVLLEGPAVFELQTADSAALHHGKLTAHVPPSARGFTVQTPRGVIVDSGTEFGLITEPTGQTDVFTFTGEVELTPHSVTNDADKQIVPAGKALRLGKNGPTPIDINSIPFVHRLPSPPTNSPRVQTMRDLVAKHPKLLHHYTFEGDRAKGEQLLDRKGTIAMREVAFGAGSKAFIRYGRGLDASTTSFTPHRTGPTSGGAALRSEKRLHFPDQLTVECLVRPGNGAEEGYVVATRASPEQRGYFLRKSKGPFFSCAIGDPPREITVPVRFTPGHWYYVATTCAREGGTTTVNMYLANVTAGQGTLTHVGGKSHLVTGSYGKEAFLRIGMGMMSNGIYRYAFSGSIDEVAIYGATLTQEELQQRLTILVEDKE